MPNLAKMDGVSSSIHTTQTTGRGYQRFNVCFLLCCEACWVPSIDVHQLRLWAVPSPAPSFPHNDYGRSFLSTLSVLFRRLRVYQKHYTPLSTGWHRWAKRFPTVCVGWGQSLTDVVVTFQSTTIATCPMHFSIDFIFLLWRLRFGFGVREARLFERDGPRGCECILSIPRRYSWRVEEVRWRTTLVLSEPVTGNAVD
jgi:hypothetical protein